MHLSRCSTGKHGRRSTKMPTSWWYFEIDAILQTRPITTLNQYPNERLCRHRLCATHSLILNGVTWTGFQQGLQYRIVRRTRWSLTNTRPSSDLTGLSSEDISCLGSFKGMGTLFPHGDYYLHYNRSQKIRRCRRHLITRRPHLHASEVDTFLNTGFRIAPHTDRSE